MQYLFYFLVFSACFFVLAIAAYLLPQLASMWVRFTRPKDDRDMRDAEEVTTYTPTPQPSAFNYTEAVRRAQEELATELDTESLQYSVCNCPACMEEREGYGPPATPEEIRQIQTRDDEATQLLLDRLQRADELRERSGDTKDPQALQHLERYLENFDYLETEDARRLLDQAEILSRKAVEGDNMHMEYITFMGYRLVHFEPGTAYILSRQLQQFMLEMAKATQSSGPQILTRAITFYRAWIAALQSGRVTPIYDEFGSIQQGFIMAAFDTLGDTNAPWEDLLKNMEPTHEQVETLMALKRKGKSFQHWEH